MDVGGAKMALKKRIKSGEYFKTLEGTILYNDGDKPVTITIMSKKQSVENTKLEKPDVKSSKDPIKQLQ